jgi:dihydroorotate dehydrogenase (NAD+) catalytic subunit
MGKIRLEVKLGRLSLKNPVLVASGTFGYGEEYKDLIDLNKLGGIIVKGTSLKPKIGNPPPRLVEVPCGLLNAIGLENVGVEEFIREKLPFLKQFKTKIIVNIFGSSIGEYKALATRLDKVGIDALEVNVSCPNIGGVVFGTDPKMVSAITKAVLQSTDLPIFVKLSPQVTDIVKMAKAAINSGADGVSLINSFPAMAIDINTQQAKLGNITGGLSGPCLKPISLKMVFDVIKALDIPVIGIGGIIKVEDALEYLIVGAKAIEVGSANFLNPKVSLEIIDGLKTYLKAKKMNDIDMIIGSLKA